SVLPIVTMMCVAALTACTPTDTKQSGNQQTQATTTTERSTKGNSEEDYYFGKYEPTLVLNVPFFDEKRTAPSGDDPMINNIWTRAYKDELGIEFNYVWEVPSQDY